MKSIVERIHNFLYASNGFENDSKTLIVLVRKISLLLVFYGIMMGTVMFLHTWQPGWFACCAVSLYACFILHYSRNHEISFPFMNVVGLLVLGSIIPTLICGLNMGFQSLLYLAMLLILFNPRLSIRTKTIAGMIAIILLVLLEIYIQVIATGGQEGGGLLLSISVLLANELFLMIGVCVVGITIAAVSQNAEHELFLYNQKLKGAADTDPLTGLFNRRSTEVVMEKIATMYGSSVHLVTVAMGDIDFFKKVNDTYGHDAGDYILKEISVMLKELPGEGGRACRWGGEEFLLIYCGKNGDEVCYELNRFISKLARHEFVYKGNTIPITMTFGIAEYDHEAGFNNTIIDADHRLYLGKSGGRNCVIF